MHPNPPRTQKIKIRKKFKTCSKWTYKLSGIYMNVFLLINLYHIIPIIIITMISCYRLNDGPTLIKCPSRY